MRRLPLISLLMSPAIFPPPRTLRHSSLVYLSYPHTALQAGGGGRHGREKRNRHLSPPAPSISPSLLLSFYLSSLCRLSRISFSPLSPPHPCLSLSHSPTGCHSGVLGAGCPLLFSLCLPLPWPTGSDTAGGGAGIFAYTFLSCLPPPRHILGISRIYAFIRNYRRLFANICGQQGLAAGRLLASIHGSVVSSYPSPLPILYLPCPKLATRRHAGGRATRPACFASLVLPFASPLSPTHPSPAPQDSKICVHPHLSAFIAD